MGRRWIRIVTALCVGLCAGSVWAAGIGGHWNPEQAPSNQNLFSKLVLEAIQVDSQDSCNQAQLRSDLHVIEELAASSQVILIVPTQELTSDELICYDSVTQIK